MVTEKRKDDWCNTQLPILSALSIIKGRKDLELFLKEYCIIEDEIKKLFMEKEGER